MIWLKKFQFTLQTVLNLKCQEEEFIQKELAKKQKKRRKIKSKIDQVQNQKNRLQKELESSEEKILDLHKSLNYRNYIKLLQEELEDLFLKLDYWDEEIKKCRQELLAKTKEKKVLVKLKERRYDEHWQEFLHEEQRLNDEVATSRFNRQYDSF